ncbi:hypothetical protein ACOMHN_012890 [Nucella lapillus]
MATLAGREHIRTTSPLYTVHDDAFFSPEPDAVAVAGAGAAPQPLQSPVQSAPMDITVSSNFDQHESHPKTLLHIRNIYLTHVEEEERRKIGWITCFNIPLGLLL